MRLSNSVDDETLKQTRAHVTRCPFLSHFFCFKYLFLFNFRFQFSVHFGSTVCFFSIFFFCFWIYWIIPKTLWREDIFCTEKKERKIPTNSFAVKNTWMEYWISEEKRKRVHRIKFKWPLIVIHSLEYYILRYAWLNAHIYFVNLSTSNWLTACEQNTIIIIFVARNKCFNSTWNSNILGVHLHKQTVLKSIWVKIDQSICRIRTKKNYLKKCLTRHKWNR